ncbi:MAG: type II toxin-antitoxin system Phd/YefM family antitoxin [Bacillota bacterium]
MLVNIHEAKTNLSRLLQKVKEGQEIIIAKAGRPVAKLIPYTEKPSKRVPGSAKDKITVSQDFNEALPDHILQEFE